MDENGENVMEGVASMALLPNGSISGHFIQLPQSICYGLHGTEIECERECSRGEDYRLIKLTITDYNNRSERDIVVECRGHDAAKICNVDHAHGWQEEVMGMLEEKHVKCKVSISFECETLKADEAAQDHIKKFMPKLAGMDAVAIPGKVHGIKYHISELPRWAEFIQVNIGKMRIVGLDFEAETKHEHIEKNV